MILASGFQTFFPDTNIWSSMSTDQAFSDFLNRLSSTRYSGTMMAVPASPCAGHPEPEQRTRSNRILPAFTRRLAGIYGLTHNARLIRSYRKNRRPGPAYLWIPEMQLLRHTQLRGNTPVAAEPISEQQSPAFPRHSHTIILPPTNLGDIRLVGIPYVRLFPEWIGLAGDLDMYPCCPVPHRIPGPLIRYNPTTIPGSYHPQPRHICGDLQSPCRIPWISVSTAEIAEILYIRFTEKIA